MIFRSIVISFVNIYVNHCMSLAEKKELLKFFLWGLSITATTKNMISILNGSNGGDPIYIISNPSIDEELWYFLFTCYGLTVRCFFPNFFSFAVSQLTSINIIDSLIGNVQKNLNSYFFTTTIKYIKLIFVLGFYLITISLLFYITTSETKLIDWINFILFLYVTVITTYLFRFHYITTKR